MAKTQQKDIQMLRLFILIISTSQILVKCELKFVVEIFRHGARTPLSDWYDSLDQVEYKGELTSTGQRQHYNLGAQLKEEYKDFLPSTFHHSQIYVRSSDYNRTLMSVASQLQGMFPPIIPNNQNNKDQYDNKNTHIPSNLTINYTLPPFENIKSHIPQDQSQYALPMNIQVIPIHSQSKDGDLVLQAEYNCKNFKKLKQEYYDERKDDVNYVIDQFKDTFDYYTNLMNKTVATLDDFQEVSSTLACDQYNGRYVPNPPSIEIENNTTFLYTLAWNFQFQQPQLLRALNTPFFSQIFDYMKPVAMKDQQNQKNKENQSNLKWVMLSAHDFNVQSISSALNLTSVDCLLDQRFSKFRKIGKKYLECEYYPRFASSLIFELHQAEKRISDNEVVVEKDEFYIRVRRDENSTICSFDQFYSRIQYFSIDFYSVCGGGKEDQQKQEIIDNNNANDESCINDNSQIYFIAGLVFEFFVILALTYFIYKNYYKLKYQNFQPFKNDKEMSSTELSNQ